MNNTKDQDQRENKYESFRTQVSRNVSVILNPWHLRNAQHMEHTERRSFQVKRSYQMHQTWDYPSKMY